MGMYLTENAKKYKTKTWKCQDVELVLKEMLDQKLCDSAKTKQKQICQMV